MIWWQAVSVVTSREAIADAAYPLFGQRGYDAISVEDIAAAAGVSRSTFFRWYGCKEAVVFPDHDRLLKAVGERLAASTASSAIAAMADAVRIVLFHYVAEGPRARERYALTTSVPALRECELVSTARYQSLFRRFVSRWGDGSETAELRAELMAAAVVSAHNRVLRRWLRREIEDPQVEIDEALATVRRLFEAAPQTAPAILVVRDGQSIETIASSLQSWLQHPEP